MTNGEDWKPKNDTEGRLSPRRRDPGAVRRVLTGNDGQRYVVSLGARVISVRLLRTQDVRVVTPSRLFDWLVAPELQPKPRRRRSR